MNLHFSIYNHVGQFPDIVLLKQNFWKGSKYTLGVNKILAGGVKT